MQSKVKNPIRIIIADDHPLFREGIHRVISLEDDIELIGEAEDGEQVVSLALSLRPDVIVLDLTMPKLNGLEAMQQIIAAWPKAKIVVLTFHSDEEYIVQVIRAGAKAYVVKDADPASLAETIRLVHSGGSVFPPSVLAKVMDATSAGRETAATKGTYPGADLTQRELEILGCLAAGLSNKEIAADLCISEKTVKNHLSNLFRKLDVADRTQAVLYGIKHKLIKLS